MRFVCQTPNAIPKERAIPLEHQNSVHIVKSGEIPPELGNLSALVSLWLNDNQLEGKVATGRFTPGLDA